MRRFVQRLADDCQGATSIEYGLIASLIAIAAIQAMSTLGENISTTFTTVGDAMAGDTGGDTAPEEPPPAAGDEGPEDPGVVPYEPPPAGALALPE